MGDIDISKQKFIKNVTVKNAKIKLFSNSNNFRKYNIKNVFILLIEILLLNIIIKNNNNTKSKYNLSVSENNKRKYDINFNYRDFDKEIITEKMKEKSGWLLRLDEAQFINGIIRKNKLKNCLEIGVAYGGSSILILNALKDIENSLLVSLDLNKELTNDNTKLIGYKAKQYFPELLV